MRLSSLLILMILLATQAFAQTGPIQSVNAIHLPTFEIYDTEGYGFGSGEYRSGQPLCEDPLIPETCSMNGIFEIDITNPFIGTGARAEFWFTGPAYDEDDVVIPGTEDDVVVVNLELTPEQQVENPALFNLTITNIEIDITSVQFPNGYNFGFPSTSLSDGQRFGIIDASNPERDDEIGTYRPDTFVTSLLDPFFDIHYEASQEQFDQKIFLPEPGTITMLITGVLALTIMHVIFRKRKVQG